MRFTLALLFLVFLNYTGYCQHNGKNNLQQRNLFGKISTIKTPLGYHNEGYAIDSFDQQGYILKSIAYYSDGDYRNNSTYWTYNNHHLMMCIDNSNEEGGAIMYNYNDTWQLIEENNVRGNFTSSTKYEYDAQGNNIRKILTWGQKGEWIKTRTISLKYNSSHQLVEAISAPSNDDNIEYGSAFYEEYEHFGFASEGYFIGRATLKYNRNGKIIEQDQFNYTGKPDGKITCKYDMNNNLTECARYSGKQKAFIVQQNYKYDKNNNWITKYNNNVEIEHRVISYY